MAITLFGAAALRFSSTGIVPTARLFSSGKYLQINKSAALHKIETMKQVDVDEKEVQQRLGNINMDFVRKAERKNKERAKMHKFFRRTDWMIASVCFALVGGIYGYTIFAIQQEKFLDDFEMPEEIDRTRKEDK